MTDDIVTRLRNWHDQRDSWQTLTEAADEIERLREQVRQLEVERDQWQTQAVRGG
jgi:polyhydroxyalkanoate synthesis regulator phasin